MPRHSFIVTRAGKVHDGYGLLESHTIIRELAGLSAEDDTVNAYDWQPPRLWPEMDWEGGLTNAIKAFVPKLSHMTAMGQHVTRLYPSMIEWDVLDKVRPLPGNIAVGGDLHLRSLAVKALPDNFSVRGSLDLRDTLIRVLPDNLSVGGDLFLQGLGITALPDNISVGGHLYLDNGGN